MDHLTYERALVIAFSAYNWYRVTTPFILNDGSKRIEVGYGEKLGIRKNEKGYEKIVLHKLGPGKVFRVPGSSPEEKKLLYAWIEPIEDYAAVHIKKASTPSTDVVVTLDKNGLIAKTIKDPARTWAWMKSLDTWYNDSGDTRSTHWDAMHEFFSFFKIPKRTVWAYRATNLSNHGKVVTLKPGIVITLQTAPNDQVRYQSWSHSYEASKSGFHGKSKYFLKANLESKQIAFCSPASFNEIKTFLASLDAVDMSFLTPNFRKIKEIVVQDYFLKKINEGADPLEYFCQVYGTKSLDKLERQVFGTVFLARCLAFIRNVYYSYESEEEIIVYLPACKKGIQSEIIEVPIKK